MQLQISGDVLAWYASITATASIAVSVFPHWHDRPRPYASLARDLVIVNHPGVSRDVRHFRLTIYNRGRRPMTITQVALHDAKAKQVQILLDLFSRTDQVASETKSASYTITQEAMDFDAIDKLLVSDARGQTWVGKFNLQGDMKLRRTKKPL